MQIKALSLLASSQRKMNHRCARDNLFLSYHSEESLLMAKKVILGRAVWDSVTDLSNSVG